MRRLSRWALNLVSVVSALSCAAACILWARTGRCADVIGWETYGLTGPTQYYRSISGIFSGRGGLLLGSNGRNGWTYSASPEYTNRFIRKVEPPNSWLPPKPRHGFGREDAYYLSGTGVTFTTGFAIAWWLLVPLTALPAALRLLSLLWRHRDRFPGRPGQNLYRVCGYDLRATPSRCPECGTVPASRATAPT